MHYNCKIFNTSQVIVARAVENKTLEVNVIYTGISERIITNEDNGHESIGNFTNETSSGPYEISENLPVYKVYLHKNGTIIRLMKPAGSSDLLGQLTKKLVEQFYPQINAKIYQSLNSSRNSTDNQDIEQDENGLFIPKYTFYDYTDGDDNYTVLQKFYDENNYVFNKFNNTHILDQPDVEFKSKHFYNKKTGMIDMSYMRFELEVGQENSTKSQVNNTEMLGFWRAVAESNFDVINVDEENDNINRCLASAIDLEEFNLRPQEVELYINRDYSQRLNNSGLLQASLQGTQTEKFDFFNKKIFNQDVSVSVWQEMSDQGSQVGMGVILNGEPII